jgi:predicted transcriptional regulator of viral defense system
VHAEARHPGLAEGRAAGLDQLAQLLAKGLYAVVPQGSEARRFAPDRFLIAAALSEDAVLAYHSALELLGFRP